MRFIYLMERIFYFAINRLINHFQTGYRNYSQRINKLTFFGNNFYHGSSNSKT